jgi:hypothetical protein
MARVVRTVIAIGAIIGAIMILADLIRSKDHDAELSCGDSGMAFVMSQTFIKRRLRAPATASFPWSFADGVKVLDFGDCEFRVKAYVDAENAFSANIRSVYTMNLRFNPSDESWTARNINIESR